MNLSGTLKERNEIQVFFRMGVAYCIWHIDDCTDIEIDVLDMVNETYIGRTSLSKVFLFTSTSLMDWNGQLSFSSTGANDIYHFC
ncbi:hypothetical protein RDI58_003642 [Solanum bulbocastanum]|uniref:Uncharacterized protein n=1 Tax=Solanum bulbocastanum TaxID=147425 RepID=A0AAN8UHY4_SOLBU